MKTEALIVVDAQRCFMPAEEGERLRVEGFGELPVPHGQEIVPAINRLIEGYVERDIPVLYTRDQHPTNTAHFSNEPNFVNTWPVHGVANTPGGELHPDLLVAQNPNLGHGFDKGTQACLNPEQDDSYTGILARDENGELLDDYLNARGITGVAVCGLALGDGAANKLCVDSTAADLAGARFEVTVIDDACEAVVPNMKETCLVNLGRVGIRLANTENILYEIGANHD